MKHRNKKGRFMTSGRRDQCQILSQRNTFVKYNEAITDHSYSCSTAEESYAGSTSTETKFNDKLCPVGEYRCLIELDSFISYMSKCKFCPVPLCLNGAKGVVHAGLGGWLHVRCTNCTQTNRIPLSKQHQLHERDKRGRSIFDVNTKLATAMIHSGIGYTQVQHFLTTLNLHGISHTTLKIRETEIGEVIESFAEESVNRALQEEVNAENEEPTCNSTALTMDNNINQEAVGNCEDGNIVQETVEKNEQLKKPANATSDENSHNINITASADATWQRRGAGRSYNSLSGVSTLIGKKTRKTLSFSIRSKRCKICSVAKRLQKEPKKHLCRKNWNGSAKAMEGSMLVEMLKSVKSRGANVESVIGDNDSTSIKMAREEFNPEIQKYDDKNHLFKNINSHLFDMKHLYKELSQKTIEAIMKNFRYMIEQNQGNPQGIVTGLKAVVNHIFGIHSYCDHKWCGFLQNADTFKHKNLPYGNDLKDSLLKKKLEEMFIEKLTKCSTSLANLSSTQANESFNSTLASKAPKAKHFSDSSSLTYRVCASDSQKNEGYSYVSQIHEQAGLSPGNATMKRSGLMDRQIARRRLKFGTRDYRKRRLDLKTIRKTNDTCCEIREGDTYRSSIGMSEKEPDMTHIPAPTQTVERENRDSPLVVFDLETTGLSRTSDIIQIAAICGERTFSTYVTPSSFISKGASEVTGITFSNSQLYHNGVPVESLPPQLALIEFCEFLETFNQPILVAHNAKSFDSKILMNQLKTFHMWSHFTSLILGFVDSLEICKELYPNQSSYKQCDLVQSILKESYHAHDALEDVTALQKLLATVQNKQIFSDKVFHPIDTSSFNDLVSAKVLTKQMANKITISGLTLQHLETVYKRGGRDGLKLILSESVNGKPRVTKSVVLVNKLFQHFESIKENM